MTLEEFVRRGQAAQAAVDRELAKVRTFVKWKQLLVWHVVRDDNATACGLLTSHTRPAALDVHRGTTSPGRLCSRCDRTKDARTMQQIPLPGERR